MSDEAELPEELVALQQEFAQLGRRVSILLLVCLLFLAGAGAGIFSSYNSTANQLATSPYTQLDMLDEKMKAMREDIGLNDQDYKDFLESVMLADFIESRPVLYRELMASEKDFGALARIHKTATHNFSSQIRGSAEWYRFHSRELAGYGENSQKRWKQLSAFKAPVDSQ